MIDSIHNAGLRISIGALKSSPCSSIHNIAGMPLFLQNRRLQNFITTASKRTLNKLKIIKNIKDVLNKLISFTLE